jgi:hypothetical protein
MTFWQFLTNVWSFLWANGTKVLGLAQGTVALIAGMGDVIPPTDVKYWLAASAVLTFWRGFSNSSIIATTQTTVTKQEVKTDADTPAPLIASPKDTAVPLDRSKPGAKPI